MYNGKAQFWPILIYIQHSWYIIILAALSCDSPQPSTKAVVRLNFIFDFETSLSFQNNIFKSWKQKISYNTFFGSPGISKTYNMTAMDIVHCISYIQYTQQFQS